MFIFSLCPGLVMGAGTKIMEIKDSTPKLQVSINALLAGRKSEDFNPSPIGIRLGELNLFYHPGGIMNKCQ